MYVAADSRERVHTKKKEQQEGCVQDILYQTNERDGEYRKCLAIAIVHDGLDNVHELVGDESDTVVDEERVEEQLVWHQRTLEGFGRCGCRRPD